MGWPEKLPSAISTNRCRRGIGGVLEAVGSGKKRVCVWGGGGGGEVHTTGLMDREFMIIDLRLRKTCGYRASIACAAIPVATVRTCAGGCAGSSAAPLRAGTAAAAAPPPLGSGPD